MDKQETHNGMEVLASIGGRFPRAKNVNELWQNLHDGVESISSIGEQEEIQL
ncbi:hypothetical protein NUACC21_04530 [Scytonema sp. NUACC21]